MRESANIEKAVSLADNKEAPALELIVGGKKVETGTFVPKAEAQSPPQLVFPSADSSKTYIAIGLDLDAPFQTFGVLGPILHWIQPGFQAKSDASGQQILETQTPFVANYIGPAPPPPSGPHRYIFFIYEQPADFDGSKYAPADGKPLGNMGRIRWDLTAFEKKAGLGEILASSYFTSN